MVKEGGYVYTRLVGWMSDGMVMGRLDSMSSWWQIGWKRCWMVVREWIRGRLAGKEEGLTVTDLQDEKRRGCLWWRSAYGSKREFAPATKGEIWSETCGREKVRSRQRKRNLVSMDLKQLWCQWERRNQGIGVKQVQAKGDGYWLLEKNGFWCKQALVE